MLVFPSMIALAQACITIGIYATTSNLFTSRRTAGGSLGPTTISPIPTAPPGMQAPPPNILDYFSPAAASRNTQSAWGDSIHQDSFDYHFQNIDGLQNKDDQMNLYVSSMSQFQASTFCWADHGLNVAQTPISQALQRPSIVAHFGMARSAYSYSSIPLDRLRCEMATNLEERSPLPGGNGSRAAKDNQHATHLDSVDSQNYVLMANEEKSCNCHSISQPTARTHEWLRCS